MGMETQRINWYDRPDLYDIAFGWDATIEIDFLVSAFEAFATDEVRRVFEPFCGTGRTAIALAQRGYAVTAADINANAIDYARERCRAAAAQVAFAVEDVCTWAPAQTVDAVSVLIDSFRHLVRPGDAEQAIAAFANGIRSGGLLILGIDVGETPIEITEEERWTIERNGTQIETAVFDLRKKGTHPDTHVVRSLMFVTEPDGRQFEVLTDAEFRKYSLPSFLSLVTSDGAFELMCLCDRKYSLDQPINRSDDYAGDIVAVFRCPLACFRRGMLSPKA